MVYSNYRVAFYHEKSCSPRICAIGLVSCFKFTMKRNCKIQTIVTVSAVFTYVEKGCVEEA